MVMAFAMVALTRPRSVARLGWIAPRAINPLATTMPALKTYDVAAGGYRGRIPWRRMKCLG